jgi:hypothetical protein
LNYNLYALRDNGSCDYANSDFVSDVVSCPNEAFTSTKLISFTPFTNAGGVGLLGVRVGLLAFFNNGPLASVFLITPSGNRIRLVSPGQLPVSSCLVNIMFTSQIPEVSVEASELCISSEFDIPCSGFFSSVFYVSALANAYSENPTGQWRLEISGSTGEFVRAQLSFSEYFSLSADFVDVDEAVDVVSCSDLGAGNYRVILSSSVGSSLQIGNIISGRNCGSYVIKIDSITPMGANYIVEGHLTTLENVFSVLRLASLTPEPDPTRATISFTLVDIEVASAEIILNEVMKVRNSYNVQLGARLTVDIGLFGFKRVAIEIFGAVVNTVSATLGWELGDEVSEETEFWDTLLRRGFFTIGPIPIPFEIRLAGIAGYELEFDATTLATASVSFRSEVSFGMEWTKSGGLRGFGNDDHSLTHAFNFDHSCSLSARVFCGPQLTFGFGKSDLIFLPINLAVLPYIGKSYTQSSDDNKQCCSTSSLEDRNFWGIETKMSGSFELGGDDDDSSDDEISLDLFEFTIGKFERDISIQCLPSIPALCPEINCEDLPEEETDPNGNNSSGQSISEPIQSDRIAVGFGDPHFQSFDRCSFNFQGSGEYLILEALDRDDQPPFILQGRLQRKYASASISYFTAIAISQNPAESNCYFWGSTYQRYTSSKIRIRYKSIGTTGTCLCSTNTKCIHRTSITLSGRIFNFSWNTRCAC